MGDVDGEGAVESGRGEEGERERKVEDEGRGRGRERRVRKGREGEREGGESKREIRGGRWKPNAPSAVCA